MNGALACGLTPCNYKLSVTAGLYCILFTRFFQCMVFLRVKTLVFFYKDFYMENLTTVAI